MREQKSISYLWSCILVLICGCQIPFLTASDRSGEERQKIAPADSSNTNNAASPTVSSEIDELRKLIEGQRKQIMTLQSIVEQQQRDLSKIMSVVGTNVAPATAMLTDPRANANEEKASNVEVIKGEADTSADRAENVNQRLTKLESDAAANKKETDAKAKQLGNFSFSGDIRARVEPFFQEGADTRTRERFRLRFNVTGKVSDEFSGGFSLTSGSLDDPISTNQTLTAFLNRKNIGIDKAYITYQPKYAKALRLDAGRFAHPWYRTPMTFDNDVNVDGLAETLSFKVKSPVFKSFVVVGFQLPFNEMHSNDKQGNNADSYIMGGQIQAQFRLGSKVRLGLYGAGIDFLRADPVAVAFAGGILKPSLPNSNTYSYSNNGIVAGYANRFAYLDAIMKLDFDTSARFPTTLLFNFVNNVHGSRERSGYWSELTFGRTKEASDMQFGYTFVRIEKDAVIGAWNESDMRSSTNVLNHKFSFAYMIKSNVSTQFTAWIGRLANPWDNPNLVPIGVRGPCTGTDLSNCSDPYLTRLQFDLNYKF
jgi:hypothetical protein